MDPNRNQNQTFLKSEPEPQEIITVPQHCLKGQCHEMDTVFYKDLNIFISTFCVCADGFQGLSKLFTTPYKISFLFVSLKSLNIFLMFTETLLVILFSVTGHVLESRPLIGCR